MKFLFLFLVLLFFMLFISGCSKKGVGTFLHDELVAMEHVVDDEFLNKNSASPQQSQEAQSVAMSKS